MRATGGATGTPGAALTARQRAFIEFFLTGPPRVRYCATRAARAAGYAWPGKQGSRLMSYPGVSAEVERRFREVCRVDKWGRPCT